MFFIVWIALSVIAGVMARNKGRSAGGFFCLSIFLSPLVGILAAAIARTDSKAMEEKDLAKGLVKKCIHCCEIVKLEAILCKHCGQKIMGL